MATTLEHLVADLADREAIRELPQRYCDCVWRGDVAGIVNLYAEDGTFAIAGGGRDRTVTGRANLLKAYGEDLSTIKPRPYIHNHVIELKGAGRASGRCYVEVRDAARDFSIRVVVVAVVLGDLNIGLRARLPSARLTWCSVVGPGRVMTSRALRLKAVGSPVS